VLLDEREYLIEQLANETLERQLWQRAHSESERLRLNAESQAANISEVAAIESDRAKALESMLKRETAKVRRRQTTGVILATIVAVESVVIAVMAATR
jgi:cell division septum initiation protein DivIVA